jgi:4-amino-4-deoxy-L-arabinose transferase-like glycosyltransferase
MLQQESPPSPALPQLDRTATPAAGAPDEAQASSDLLPLLAILVVGAAVRLLLWYAFQDYRPSITDETDYDTLAINLVKHQEFAFSPGEPTSLRPPLYPALVAVVYAVCGVQNYPAVRLVQAVLSLGTVLLVYALGRMLWSRRVALWAAGLCCFYPSLLGFNNLLLTEVLFTFLLVAFCVLLVAAVQRRSLELLAAAGVVLGLGALTRSVLWLFPPVLALYLLLAWRGSFLRRLAAVTAAVLPFVAVIAPWSIRNTHVQETFVVVDVMGGRNFMIGNYQHTPLYRSWAAIELKGEKNWFHEIATTYAPEQRRTQGQIDKLAMRQGLKFVAENSGLTLARSVVKFFDFWGLERELIAGAKQGIFGTISTAEIVVLAVVITSNYLAAMFLGLFGIFLAAPADRRLHAFLLLLIAFVCGMHTIVFGHSRYHLPLMPLILLYAAAAVVYARSIWQQRRRWPFWLACGCMVVLVCGWTWLFFAVDKNLI